MTELSDYQRIVERPQMARLNHSIDILGNQVQRLQFGLKLALEMLSPHEPPDSRAVSNEFVALALLARGDENTESTTIIREAAEARGIVSR